MIVKKKKSSVPESELNFHIVRTPRHYQETVSGTRSGNTNFSKAKPETEQLSFFKFLLMN